MGIKIGPLEIDNNVLLAPMSGVSDLPFRILAREFGAGLAFSEMIASQAMIRENERTLRMAGEGGMETPMAVQLAGCEPHVMAQAARLNEARGAHIIDINMGCPVKKVVNGHAGSALMRDIEAAKAIISATVEAVDVPVTLKMRTGWDHDNRNAPDMARMAQDCGIAMITVHGRTRCQFYKGKSDWDFIASVKDGVDIPVIANGDITTFEEARSALEKSGADGIMIGRGSYGRPWFPGQVARYLETGEIPADLPLEKQRDILLRHYEDILSHYGTGRGQQIARKHVGWYSQGLKNSAGFRAAINATLDADETRRLIHDLYAPLIEREAA